MPKKKIVGRESWEMSERYHLESDYPKGLGDPSFYSDPNNPKDLPHPPKGYTPIDPESKPF